MNLTALMLVALLLITGCGPSGPNTYPVSGTVTLDGEPIPSGEILFIPEEGGATPIPGRIVDGQYQLRSPAGEMRVEIRATREFGEVDPAMGARPQQQYVPARYNTASELKATVTESGPNDLPFNLTEN